MLLLRACMGFFSALVFLPLFTRCPLRGWVDGVDTVDSGGQGVRESVAGLSGHSLTAKGGNRGCWSGCLGGGFTGDQTDRRASTFFLIDAGIGRTLEQGTIGPHIPIGLHPFPDANTLLSTLSTGGRSGQGGQWWTAEDP